LLSNEKQVSDEIVRSMIEKFHSADCVSDFWLVDEEQPGGPEKQEIVGTAEAAEMMLGWTKVEVIAKIGDARQYRANPRDGLDTCLNNSSARVLEILRLWKESSLMIRTLDHADRDYDAFGVTLGICQGCMPCRVAMALWRSAR